MSIDVNGSPEKQEFTVSKGHYEFTMSHNSYKNRRIKMEDNMTNYTS